MAGNRRGVQVSDISEHQKAEEELILVLAEDAIKRANENNQDVDPRFHALSQRVKNINKKQLLSCAVKDRIRVYPNGPLTGRDLMLANTLYKKEAELVAYQQGNRRSIKIDHLKYEVTDGPTTMYSYEHKTFLLVAFDKPITKKLFAECKVEYTIFNADYISRIPTFFKVINKAEEIGIPKNNLHEVFQCYLKTCIPEKKGTISSDQRSLAYNVDKMADILNIEEELVKLQNMLKKVSHSPGQELDDLKDSLKNIYSVMFYLLELSRIQDLGEIIQFLKDSDTTSIDMKIEEASAEILNMAQRNLLSEEAQDNLNILCEKVNGNFNKRATKEAIRKVDAEFPLTSPQKLPGTLIYVGYNLAPINGRRGWGNPTSGKHSGKDLELI
ncbi:MAG: hypothetical protein QF775_01870 [archaeon]|nr:hypothetical protein [archaeon]